MAKGTTIILLKLEGVLQSWGDHSKWDYRDSADFPSKSGVAGLLACAMGMERGDPAMAELRKPCDVLETVVDKKEWPFPTYEDMLFEL